MSCTGMLLKQLEQQVMQQVLQNNQGYRLLQSDEVTTRITELEQELETNVDVIEEIESQIHIC